MVGRDVREEDIANTAALSQTEAYPGEAKSKGQILWIRSISRLQQQVFGWSACACSDGGLLLGLLGVPAII